MPMPMYELGEIDYTNFIVNKRMHDVSNELKFAERLFIELECCDTTWFT